MELALIDLDASLDEQAAAMSQACESVGFFRIPSSTVFFGRSRLRPERTAFDSRWRTGLDPFAESVARSSG